MEIIHTNITPNHKFILKILNCANNIAADVFTDVVGELGPVTPLDSALAEMRVGEISDAGGGGNLDLVAAVVVVKLVLDHPLPARRIGSSAGFYGECV
ncbi:hypothetical protein Q3G72_011465 [Acer saccharum]|nr:hypothetical protein Q3G72_011465 [Acer saccharum]